MKSPRILLGRSDFASLRQDGGLYVDKSDFVSSVLAAGADVQLHPRPRRFGKTLNLSTLRYFLEKGEDRSALFSDLAVWQDEEARKHFQRYPVINLTFKEAKQPSWHEAHTQIKAILAEEVTRHAYLLDDETLDVHLRAKLLAVKAGEQEPVRLLRDLCTALSQHHGERVVILIDEYDAPLLAAWEHGYFEEASAWFKTFLSAGLKDNALLFKGVLTGILRIARESMFSDLNNITVFSLLQRRMPEPFGFTEPEVQGLLMRFGRQAEAEDVRRWYNGYRFGDTTVYNPWSILNLLADPGSPFQPWWLNTSENRLLRRLLLERIELQADFATLLSGGQVRKRIDENVTLRGLGVDDLWSLLLFSGYLRADAVEVERGRSFAMLSLPNAEVSILWEDTFLDWLVARAGNLEPLHRALLSGDVEATRSQLSAMLLRHVSAHDVKETQDEAFYHAFVLGLLVSLERTHAVRSNREYGDGRADVMLIPKQPGRPGVVLEFKTSPIHLLGIAFSGKEVAVRAGAIEPLPSSEASPLQSDLHLAEGRVLVLDPQEISWLHSPGPRSERRAPTMAAPAEKRRSAGRAGGMDSSRIG